MDFSIVIPVFNKASFTKHCLETLRPTLAEGGTGEVIVVDNASSDDTPEILKAFPWVRAIRNERNIGFAGANNQGAAVAAGEYLVLLNNDTQPLPGWLGSMLRTAREERAGAVGARLLYPNRTIQHGGVLVRGIFFSNQTFAPFHDHIGEPADVPEARGRSDVQVVTGACLVTPRELYSRLGGLDETFWNGYEDVDYCFKVREAGLRVVYDGDAVLYHFESQSGAQRFRKQMWNTDVLQRRWRGRIAFDASPTLRRRKIFHGTRTAHGGLDWQQLSTPRVTLLVHGAAESERAALEEALRRNHARVTSIVWLGGSEDIERAQEELRVRGLRYAAFVDARSRLNEGWLDELIRQLEATTTCAAATYAPERPTGENERVVRPDARCTLLSLVRFPAHARLRPAESWDAIVADFCNQVLPMGFAGRNAGLPLGELPARDARVVFGDDETVERALSRPAPPRGLVSIVTLSWNAPQFTKLALHSIKRYASEPYEVIVVDNGSGPETLAMLREIDDPHVRIVYNATNRGFAGGNNDGLAAARGEYVILLNNDVIVTEGWIDGLLRPFAQMRNLGISAPRSNRVAGHQLVPDAGYEDEAGLHVYSKARAARYRGRGYVADRAIGLCLCISRTVLDEIGGLDEAYAVGNFEDDDYCVRVRAAGYQIYICDDVFIHHFGSQSFAANKVDYAATMRGNWEIFAKKWGYPPAYPDKGYNPREAIFRGFDRNRHYVPISAPPEAHGDVRTASLRFHAIVDDNASWDRAAAFARRYVQAFLPDDPVTLAIGTTSEMLDAATLGKRLVRSAEKLGVAESAIPDIAVSDEEPGAPFPPAGGASFDIGAIEDRSPSALRRMLKAKR